MRSNSLGLASTRAQNLNSTKNDYPFTKTITVTHNNTPVWLTILTFMMGIVSIIVSGIMIWRIEHVHAEILASVYECNGRPLNDTVCTVVAHL
jgi:hypothetical protein